MLIRFAVWGNIRFLSHAETVRVFQRACVRAGIKIQYSHGFNPHPKLSLPLPRSVGVESDDDLLCIRIDESIRAQEHKCTSTQEHKSTSELCDSIKAGLSEHLPEGLQLLSVTIAEGKTSFQPCSATYVLKVKPEYLDDELKTRIGRLLASETLNVQRPMYAGKSTIDDRNLKIKDVDVRDFLKSIVLKNECIVIECRISSAGSIRVEEILNLLELDIKKLAAPIRRTSVQWRETNDGRQMTEDG